MLKKIQAFFAAEESDDVNDEAALHLAAAVLLIEVAKSDHVVRDIQIEQLKDVLGREWQLGDADLADLVEVARDAAYAVCGYRCATPASIPIPRTQCWICGTSHSRWGSSSPTKPPT